MRRANRLTEALTTCGVNQLTGGTIIIVVGTGVQHLHTRGRFAHAHMLVFIFIFYIFFFEQKFVFLRYIFAYIIISHVIVYTVGRVLIA